MGIYYLHFDKCSLLKIVKLLVSTYVYTCRQVNKKAQLESEKCNDLYLPLTKTDW